MELVLLFATALGLAALAGINFYLTAFVLGLGVRLGWVSDGTTSAAFEHLGEPAVLAAALALFVVQFVADKVPWADSLWHVTHLVVHPVGAALLAWWLASADLAVGTFGAVALSVVAGTFALAVQWVRVAARLAINTTAEPFSNVAVSCLEDLVVAAGLALVLSYPAAGLAVAMAAAVVTTWSAPRATRFIRAMRWLLWRWRRPAREREQRQDVDDAKSPTPLARAQPAGEFAPVRCVVGRVRQCGGLRRHLLGAITVTRSDHTRLAFAPDSAPQPQHTPTPELTFEPAGAALQSRFLCEVLVARPAGDCPADAEIEFYFSRRDAPLAHALVESLEPPLQREPADE